MYRKGNPHQMKFQNFYLPFGGELSGENRWVILAEKIPWQQIEQNYSVLFNNDEGCPAKAARVGFGALIIKERLGTTDRETVEQIRENPYLQYFLGLAEYHDEPPFHHSMMTHFRKRFSKEMLAQINDKIVEDAMNKTSEVADESPDDDDKPSNNGKLIVDATCTPADITYPTDLNLLNDAREKTEEIIDAMHTPYIGEKRKPRTYRQKGRKDYLAIAKQKKPGYKKIRKAIGKQLRYLKRNLQTIAKRVKAGLLQLLSKRMYRNLLVIGELYRQQLWMYENRSHKIADRIVSISQPHVRPIVRGKAKSKIEFGAKISVSLVNGFSFVDRISWDSYNESGDLESQIESYHNRFGFYPKSVHADQIYRTRKNHQYCKEKGIRLSGPPLGRPKKVTETNASELQQERRIHRQDEIDRIAIEGKFGQGKRRFTLDRIMAKLARTSEATIAISFIVMNLERILSILLYFLLCFCRRWRISLRVHAAGDQNRHQGVQIAA
jgi:IS5 family transposase